MNMPTPEQKKKDSELYFLQKASEAQKEQIRSLQVQLREAIYMKEASAKVISAISKITADIEIPTAKAVEKIAVITNNFLCTGEG